MLLTQQDAKALREQIQISGLQEFETEIVEQSRAMCSLVGIEEVEPAEVGITKFGGSPDVPASFAQTEIKTSSGGMMQLDDCVFIFQINFEELQPFAQGLDLNGPYYDEFVCGFSFCFKSLSSAALCLFALVCCFCHFVVFGRLGCAARR